ncbi:MAG: CoA-acylating methylmalonate-semialdehyde dehydrogenase [Myxococcales bacterium]|nr:CoA-acylating methylmalonate-semialdehyde dehydrogenase [Myxococcales bacterium]MCB9715211.1 CoA-acylating methylmalonate-semialdehyde dehydrogenase [Myxococcales bacterium]
MIPKFEASSYEQTPFIDARNWIGGEWVEPSGDRVLPVVNPRHGETMAKVRMSTASDVDAAVQAASTAVEDWKQWPLRERAHVMYRARGLMMRDIDELSWLVSHENGKIFAEAKAEVEKGIECVEYGCALPNIAAGNQLEVSRGVSCEVVYAPLGVVAGIVPFNFPFMVPLWMLPQALVGGNAFVLKPSEQVPLSSLKLAQIFEDAGLPKGILNLVQGDRETVEALCDHPGIEAVAFVGSTRVAKLVYGRSAAAGKRALCLGGAKNHLIVVPDADVELTADNVVASYTGCAGQRCMAASVMVAVGDVQHIIDEVAKRSAAMTLGQDLGPITTAAAVERINGYITQAEQQGAKVLVDGRAASVGKGGYWVGPTLLDHVKGEMPAAREEIFGPVLSIVRVANLDQAIALENANPYGNASSVYTTSGDVARRVMNEVEAGMCGVNIGVPVPREPFGFGGWNDSKFGHGNITGWDGFRFWTRPRKITSKWALQKDATWMS